MNAQIDTLILAYNADQGILNAMTDSAHKLLSPDTYDCSLCKVTHGMVSMRWEWRKFLGSLDLKKEFYHRDDFSGVVDGLVVPLPAILTRAGDAQPQVLISHEELKAIVDLSELIALLKNRLD